MNPIITVAPDAPAGSLRDAIAAAGPGDRVAVVDDGFPDDLVAVMAVPLDIEGVATASPVPAGGITPVGYPGHRLLPPPPSLALPCATACVIDVDAVISLGHLRPARGTAAEQLVSLGLQLLQHGWRHVAAPGVARSWDPARSAGIADEAAWNARTVAGLVGPANVGLETHTTWAASRVEPPRVMIDGACLDGDLHTGTQHLVIEIARHLKAVRPDSPVLLATPRESIRSVAAELSGVEVVARDGDLDADVMYRPYQMLRAGELATVMDTGRRRLVGQLDMIGFSNPFYHPSPQLFSFTRNLQRHMMRACDGVTFISGYGLDAAVAECPDLAPSRLHVVSCGADPTPSAAPVRPSTLGGADRFVLCLSATFWHKNRSHAIATFAELATSNGYDGSLVVVGPEPYYGRSDADDDALLSELPADVASRVLRIGSASADEKWWLLEHADAVLYPSVVEGFGLVPFEAAAVGTPCLAFGGTAPAEVLAGTDAIIPTWDPTAWAARVASWIADPAMASAGVDAVRAVAAATTWRRCAELTWDAIDATLAQPSRSLVGEDGGVTSKLVGDGGIGWIGRRTVTARFTAARVIPAITRRMRTLTHRRRTE